MAREESPALASARESLTAFEKDITTEEAAAELTDALASLAEVVEEGGAEAQVARNLAAVYARKAAAAVEAVLARPGEPALAELRHWQEVLGEFGRSGFESPEASAALSKANRRLATRYVSQMTPAEKEVLLRKLEAEAEAEAAKKRGGR